MLQLPISMIVIKNNDRWYYSLILYIFIFWFFTFILNLLIWLLYLTYMEKILLQGNFVTNELNNMH
jgi:hypothetical protein